MARIARPILDHPLIEFAATIPADTSSRWCNEARLKEAVKPFIPEVIYNRTDKVGFATP